MRTIGITIRCTTETTSKSTIGILSRSPRAHFLAKKVSTVRLEPSWTGLLSQSNFRFAINIKHFPLELVLEPCMENQAKSVQPHDLQTHYLESTRAKSVMSGADSVRVSKPTTYAVVAV